VNIPADKKMCDDVNGKNAQPENPMPATMNFLSSFKKEA